MLWGSPPQSFFTKKKSPNLQHRWSSSLVLLLKLSLLSSPKRPSSTSPQDFKPISLCILFISDCIKCHVPNHMLIYTTPLMLLFTVEMSVTTSAQEIVHSFQLVPSRKCKRFMLNLDLSKAFDHIEWTFIVQGCRIFNVRGFMVIWWPTNEGFASHTLSILIDGQPMKALLPKREYDKVVRSHQIILVIATLLMANPWMVLFPKGNTTKLSIFFFLKWTRKKSCRLY